MGCCKHGMGGYEEACTNDLPGEGNLSLDTDDGFPYMVFTAPTAHEHENRNT